MIGASLGLSPSPDNLENTNRAFGITEHGVDSANCDPGTACYSGH
ncbi:hypothetical protein LMG18096_03316 [Ralstonia holmesii]|uniref:Uncharacterized protein n=1 Tax=Ralstonia holmesii TaxID=3058602 RepID=A0ABC8QEC8_9RALS|nr:hypothetical protein LMG18096_03316 [Ralstonia sp. LMG 32967]CAJ0805885.1 hypothetical protein LMG18093_00086 [Ralstonia sp. LMG 32967]